MPGNEAEDRVHNFFPQEDLPSGHHHSQAADGSWPGLGNNLWPGSQRQNGFPSSNSKGYNLQQSDIYRGQSTHSFQVADGLNYGQPMPGSVLAKSHPQSQLLNSNDYMHGHQIGQMRQNEANFMDVGAESDRYAMTSGGLSTYESQGQNGFENNVESVRSESSKSRTSFDFLGGQEQVSRQHIGMFQSLPQQQSGFNDTLLMQQQAMLRNMQELQRQQLEARENNSLNQNPSIINGTPISPITAASNNAWPTEPSAGNKSWLRHATQAAQGPPNELGFPSEQGQSLSFNQSIYGRSLSNTSDSPSCYSHVSLDNHQMQQMAMYSDFSRADQYRGPIDQVNVQDGPFSSRHGFQEGNLFGQPSGQGLTRGGMYSGDPQLVNSLQKDSPVQELAGPSGKMEGKAVLPLSSPQDAVGLDPTEEKILFGDGNIWDSFGDSANIEAVGGSWSALMQSAVAETSSNDVGLQKEWSGPSIQNTEVSTGPFYNDANKNKSFQGIPKFQQSVLKLKSPLEHGDRLQMGYNQEVSQHSSEERNKWLSRDPLQKPPAEETQSYQKTTHSSDTKSIPGSKVAQQNVPSQISGQLYGKPNSHDDMVTPSSSKNEVLGFYDNEGRLLKSDSYSQKRMFHGEMSQGVHMWKMVPDRQSTGGLEQVRMGISSSQVNRELDLNNCSGKLNSSTAQASNGTSSNSNNLNFWKQAEPSNFIGENMHNSNKDSLFPGSSMNGYGNDVVSMHTLDNSERKENFCESHHSNVSQHANDKVRLDGSDARDLLSKKHKGPGQGSQNVSCPPKFQYHPMGNLDENIESPFGRRDVSNNQSQRYSGQSKIFGQFTKTSSEMEKGHMFRVQQNGKGAADSPSRGTLTGFARNNSPLSQNVPKFLHNMDQFKENSNSDGSIGPLQRSQSPSSGGFDLHLGFQSFSTQSHALSHSSAQLAGSVSSAHTTHETREKDNTSQAGPFPSFHETSQGEFKRTEISRTSLRGNDAPECSTLSNLDSASTSGFCFPRVQLQGQQVIGAIDRHSPHSSQLRIDQKDSLLTSGDASKITEAIATPVEAHTHEIPIERMPNAWTKSPSQKNLLGGLSQKKSPHGIFRPGQLNNNTVSTLGKGQEAKGGLCQLGSSADLTPEPSASQGKECVLNNLFDASPSNSASTERDFEAFGRSLKPNNLPLQNYSLLNQLRTMQSTETDSSNRALKRFKEAESNLGSQIEQRATVGDPKIRNFSGSTSPVDNNNSSSLLANISQNVHAPSRMDSSNYPCSTSTSSLRLEHSQISPQMAPSWFEQYDTFKSGQMLPLSDAHKHSTLKAVEQQLSLGKSFELCANNMMEQANAATTSVQAGNIWQKSVPTPVMAEKSPSAQLMAHDFTDKGLAVAKPKEPKSVVPLPSWHKEVTQGSPSHLTTSMAEVEWAKAANRVIDKVEDKGEAFENGPPRLRSKRRLTSTTQLMQQLFRPPESGILSCDALSNSQAVACIGARVALGDACSLMLCSKSDSCEPLDSINSSIDKHKTTGSKRIRHQHLSEVAEHFVARAKKLESDFVRLDKRASMVDSRIESQELDKVSVINRFARYHGRGQAELAPPGPQRYVTPLPMPRVLSERLQCLSL